VLFLVAAALFAGRETAFMNVAARDASGVLLFERVVKLSGRGFAD
jgi:hypothetical protein